MSSLETGQSTLFGGDVTGFTNEFGPRLFEALFRIENDPDHYETRHTALAEIEYLTYVAKEFGLNTNEIADLVEALSSDFARDDSGRLFIDTPEGHEAYFGKGIVTAMPGPAYLYKY